MEFYNLLVYCVFRLTFNVLERKAGATGAGGHVWKERHGGVEKMHTKLYIACNSSYLKTKATALLANTLR